MAMKLALSTFAWYNHTLEKAIEYTAKLGYRGIEIEGNRPHLFPGDYTKDKVKRIRRLLDDYGLTCCCITAFDGTHMWCLSHPDKRIYRDTIDHIKRCIENAHILGAEVVESVTGKPLIIEDEREKAWERTREAYIELSAVLKNSGVKIGIENEQANVIETIDDTLRMLKELGSTHIGALLDLGHANMESYMTVSDAIRKLSSWLVHMHADDNDGLVHRHLPIGEGGINWEVAIKTVKEIGYKGWISVEMEMVKDPIAASYESRKILEGIWSG